MALTFEKNKIIVIVAVLLVLSVIGQATGGAGNSSTTPKGGSPSGVATGVAETSSSDKQPAQTEEVPVDKSMLQASIDQWSSLTADSYTPDSFEAFSAALSAANEVNNNPDATQSEVDKANKALVAAHSSLKEAFNPANYQQVAYEDVARNPDNYKGQKLVFSGKVLQVVEGTSETDLRVATDGKYDDVVLVGYDPSILAGKRVLEDDNVTVYGMCVGLYSYQSTLGGKISVPGIYADSVVIN